MSRPRQGQAGWECRVLARGQNWRPRGLERPAADREHPTPPRSDPHFSVLTSEVGIIEYKTINVETVRSFLSELETCRLFFSEWRLATTNSHMSENNKSLRKTFCKDWNEKQIDKYEFSDLEISLIYLSSSVLWTHRNHCKEIPETFGFLYSGRKSPGRPHRPKEGRYHCGRQSAGDKWRML